MGLLPRPISADSYGQGMARAIIAAGGWAHPGDDIVEAVQTLIKPHGFAEVDVVRDGASFIQALQQSCDLLAVGSCWFSMGDARYTDDQRAEYAVEMTPALAQSLGQARDDGCALFALHTAVICFDGLPVWREWLGGAWNWQTSFHPPPAEMDVEPVAHEALSFEPFVVSDELYQGLDVDDAVTVVAQSGAGHPLAWLQETEHGRSTVNLLGHDHRSLSNEHHRALNEQLLAWVLDTRGEERDG